MSYTFEVDNLPDNCIGIRIGTGEASTLLKLKPGMPWADAQDLANRLVEATGNKPHDFKAAEMSDDDRQRWEVANRRVARHNQRQAEWIV